MYGKDDVLSHVMCFLGKTENDTEIQQKNFLLQSIFLSGRKFEKIQYQSYLQKQGMKFERKGIKQGGISETHLMW